MMTNREPSFSIGQRFRSPGKNPRICTVIDIHKTFNAKGEMVKFRYVATHEFCGQTVTDYDVVETSIAMRKIE